MSRKQSLRISLTLILVAGLGGCYYLQAARGQMEVMAKREPIEEVLVDPATSPELAQRLRLLKQAREFAVSSLGLPDNDSYRSYADLGREYVVWNVFAAPEFSIEPKRWCFPIVGCVAYRGYFARQAAVREARKLEDDGFDVHVAGVAAYSTLGRFADPILNTMMDWSEHRIVRTLFHELAHQKLYVRDDTEFNESFATVVAATGLERWLLEQGRHEEIARLTQQEESWRHWLSRIELLREELEAVYASRLSPAEKRRAKFGLFAELARSPLAPADPPANNAELVPLVAYYGLSGEFRDVLSACAGSLPCFYEEVGQLAGLEPSDRRQRLAAYR